MDSSRRRVLQLLGLSSLVLTATPVINAFAKEAEQTEEPKPVIKPDKKALTAKQWAMVIDTRKFKSAADVEPLAEVCDTIHNVPHLQNKRHEIKWIWETHYHNAFPGEAGRFLSEEVEHRPFIVLCNHCENPPCVRACPTKATFVVEKNGIVAMDFHRCIGCRFCMAACPYGARSFNWQDPRPFIKNYNPDFPTRMRGVVEKCNFCGERLALGLEPACVEVCKGTGAMVFGDLNDPDSEIRKVLDKEFTIQRKPSAGTMPSVFYIV